jgi:RNA polymerase sigma-70 factor (ECF subfamily)
VSVVLKARGEVRESFLERLDILQVHREHADYIWRSLYRCGVREADLPDLLQEVLLVVHRQADRYEPTGSLRGWLFGICLRLAKNHRRRAHVRRERPLADGFERASTDDPERALESRRAGERAARLLDALDPSRRAVFVMFEVEGLSGAEIAQALGVPLGTVHSRLHTARRELTQALARERARERAGP